MKKLYPIIILLIGVALSCAKGYEATKNSNSYQVSITLDKNPPVVGENQLTIGVKDSSGKVVSDAGIKIDYSMPAMPGMPAMHYTTEALWQKGAYKATVNFSMSGAWDIAIKISRNNKIETVNFNVDVR